MMSYLSHGDPNLEGIFLHTLNLCFSDSRIASLLAEFQDGQIKRFSFGKDADFWEKTNEALSPNL